MWLRDILGEFGIRIKDISGSTSDGGSDVKRAMTSLDDSKPWEWCIPHMTNRAVQDAFGTSLDPKKSKNAAARDLVSAVKSVIEHFNKSSNSQTRLAELQRSEVGEKVESRKFVSHAPHRFLSMNKVVRRVLELCTPLTSFYGEKRTTFPLAEKYGTLTQLYSLLAPAEDVMRDTQNGTEVTGRRAVLSLAKLRMYTLPS
ncbi:hypothetical protein PsorP6_003772 [Peronosclerospora sorghi]|uniref:Uncharacterized protein n=1 Tax=Peronosclerospora sorghi TaxID=230839 RepID=A0ACC0VMC0_9STRA|nr:hypothetical protein PsorP6_003772 [Peronosclerospora sorghi]